MNTDIPLAWVPRIAARLLFLRRSQWWSPERVGRYADARLRNLVRHAGRHVPYYRALFRDIGLDPETFRGRADLPRIPPLDKQTFRTRHQEFVADNAAAFRPRWKSTSGSTGAPLRFQVSAASCIHDAAAHLRTYAWAGFHPYLTRAVWSRYQGQDWDVRYRMGGRCLGHNPHMLEQEVILRLWHEINRFKPAVFSGYPVTLLLIGRVAREAGLRPHRPRALICVGETLTADMRERLADLYGGAQVFDCYGLAENAALIAECPAGSLHVCDDYAWHEFVDAAGAPVAEGPCEILGTGYFGHAMPMIRYRTGDTARVRPAGRRCACGRPSRAIEALEGRRVDLIQAPDGRTVAALPFAICAGRGIAASQFVQERHDHIYVNILPDADFDPASLRDVEHAMRHRLGPDIRIEFRTVERLERRAGHGGKTPMAISRICECPYEPPKADPP